MPVLSIEEAYSILQLSSNASESEVKTAYRKLALKMHPDKNPGDPEAHKNFLKISEAYKRITDPDSFQDEDEGEYANEEEMMAMFSMMFAEMFGGFGGFGGGMDMFDMMEMMMEAEDDEDSDDEDDDYEQDGIEFMFGHPGMGGGRMNGLEGMLEAMIEGNMYSDDRHSHKKSKGRAPLRSSARDKASTNKQKKRTVSASSESSPPRRSKTQEQQSQKDKQSVQPVEENFEDDEEEVEWETDSSEADKKKSKKHKKKSVGAGFNGRMSDMERMMSMFGGDDDEDYDDDEVDDREAMMMAMMMSGMMGGVMGAGGGGFDDIMFGMDDGDFGGSRKKKQSKKGSKAKVEQQQSIKASSSSSSAAGGNNKASQPPQAKKPVDDSWMDDPSGVMGSNKKRNKAKPTPARPSASSAADTSSTGPRPTVASAFKASEDSTKDAAKSTSSKDVSTGFSIGDRVKVSNRITGQVAYVGPVDYAKGTYIGVITDNPTDGKNNGSVKGTRYFQCANGRGLMCRPAELTILS